MSLVSIVTVVKDDQAGLDQTYQSLVSQTELESGAWQWIVVDGSAQPLTVADNLPDGTQVKHELQKPEGIYAAMNRGLDVATGDYVYFLNAGDTLAAAITLRSVIGDLRSHEPVWLFGPVLFFNEQGSRLTEREWDYATERRNLFARGLFPPHQGTIMRTSVLRDVGGFSRDLDLVADYETVLKVSLVADPLRVSYPIAHFRQGGASSTEWRSALREFHRARVRIFHPRGAQRLQEWVHTGMQAMYQGASRVKSRLLR